MTKRTHDIVERLQEPCEYCGQEERYGHNAICVMNTVEELRAEIERLRREIGIWKALLAQYEKLGDGPC